MWDVGKFKFIIEGILVDLIFIGIKAKDVAQILMCTSKMRLVKWCIGSLSIH